MEESIRCIGHRNQRFRSSGICQCTPRGRRGGLASRTAFRGQRTESTGWFLNIAARGQRFRAWDVIAKHFYGLVAVTICAGAENSTVPFWPAWWPREESIRGCWSSPGLMDTV
jgi:hypothetical protein